MDLPFRSVARLIRFIDEIEKETYPELPSPLHSEITGKVLDFLLEKYRLSQNARILDVGCGQGPALDAMAQKGYRATGITLNDEDVHACRARDHHVLKMDQSFLDFPDDAFDLVWARHVIEHSIFPCFTLAEFKRVLQPGGHMYLEVPAPETACRHETNGNHYSVLGHGAWTSLLGRSGFKVLEEVKFNFTSCAGPDEYWGFVCVKEK